MNIHGPSGIYQYGINLRRVDVKSILTQEGFNVRQNMDVQELRASIKEKGVYSPLVIRKAKKEPDNPEQYIVIDGHRRLEAVKGLDANESGIYLVPCILIEDDLSEADMNKMLILYNSGSRLNMLELGDVLRRIIKTDDSTNAELADRFGYSTAHVSNSILLSRYATAKTREYIALDKLKPTAALEAIRINLKESKRVEERETKDPSVVAKAVTEEADTQEEEPFFDRATEKALNKIDINAEELSDAALAQDNRSIQADGFDSDDSAGHTVRELRDLFEDLQNLVSENDREQKNFILLGEIIEYFNGTKGISEIVAQHFQKKLETAVNK